jgi:hypothetical protein
VNGGPRAFSVVPYITANARFATFDQMDAQEKSAAALSRIEDELGGIASAHGARLERAVMDDGLIVRSMETDEKLIARAEGHSDLQVASRLLSNAKAGGRA